MAATDTDHRAERVLLVPCRQCGTDFTPVRPHQRFCRPSCRLAHFKVAPQPRLPLADPEDLFRVPFE
jgi:hypothetical protein